MITNWVDGFYNDGSRYLETSVEYQFDSKGSICNYPEAMEIVCLDNFLTVGSQQFEGTESYLAEHQVPCN